MTADQPEQPSSTPANRSSEPDRPQIGIVHLLVWTACVAVYLGLSRTVFQMSLTEDSGLFIRAQWVVPETLNGIGCGSGLAGLVLWAARWRRGLPFPKHPGEYLLVMLGMAAVLNLLTVCLASGMSPTRRLLLLAVVGGYLVLHGLILLWPVLAVKSRRWRRFFAFLLGVSVLRACAVPLLASIMRPLWMVLVYPGLDLIVAAVLVATALRDHAHGNRYPWSHWFGVGTQLWMLGVSVILPLVGIIMGG